MKIFRSYFLAIIGFAILAGSLVLSGSFTSSAKAPDDVNVVNTPGNPVPTKAQGTTAIAGTVQAQQSGNWNVGITGTPTVSIGNTAAAPVLVRDVENPARQPFGQTFNFTIPDGMIQGQTSLSLPAGKHLVIEYVSGLSEFNPISFGGPLVYGALNTDVGGQVFYPWNAPSANGICVASQLVHAYVSQSVMIFVERAALQGSQQVKVTVTGYLVDAP